MLLVFIGAEKKGGVMADRLLSWLRGNRELGAKVFEKVRPLLSLNLKGNGEKREHRIVKIPHSTRGVIDHKNPRF